MESSMDDYKEKTLPSGEVITFGKADNHPRKPWNVTNWDGSDCRWSIDFATAEEAEVEYNRRN